MNPTCCSARRAPTLSTGPLPSGPNGETLSGARPRVQGGFAQPSPRRRRCRS